MKADDPGTGRGERAAVDAQQVTHRRPTGARAPGASRPRRLVRGMLQGLVPPGDLLRDPLYRRLWLSILTSGFAGQVTLLAIPLTAAVLLKATPIQMGRLTAVELAPFVLFSLPAGVWLDRVRKLPVYIGGELTVAITIATVPAAWALGQLGIGSLYAVSFVIGCVSTLAGSAAQIVLTQVVPRPRLVEAHAKNALANAAAEVAGPGLAGALIRALGAPLALVADGLLLLGSVAILAGLRLRETAPAGPFARFWPALRDGLRFVARVRLLVVMALLVGTWELCQQTAMVVQILFATRQLGLNAGQVGLCYVGVGVGTITASALGHRLAQRIGVGRSLLGGLGLSGAGWLQLACAPLGPWGVASFVLMLVCFGAGAVLIFINFLALRQAVTPVPLLGRMTSTMRWLILMPAVPGALVGGWLGEHAGLRWALACGGLGALLLAAAGWKFTALRTQRSLPDPHAAH